MICIFYIISVGRKIKEARRMRTKTSNSIVLSLVNPFVLLSRVNSVDVEERALPRTALLTRNTWFLNGTYTGLFVSIPYK